MSRNKEDRGAAFGGAPTGAAATLGLCSLFLLIYLFILWIFMDIPYIFLIYSTYIYIYIYICPKYFAYSFLCMFHNLFSQQIYIQLFNRSSCIVKWGFDLKILFLYIRSLAFSKQNHAESWWILAKYNSRHKENTIWQIVPIRSCPNLSRHLRKSNPYWMGPLLFCFSRNHVFSF